MSYIVSNRMQPTMFPETIDNYISANDPVRAYDAFVEALDFSQLGISLIPTKGAESYYPKEMLKLLIYGYSYKTHSSRNLEKACHHNLSFIWLMGGLKPDYRTIARFRDQYKKAIKKILKQSVRMCIDLKLIDGNILFFDGSGMRANATIRHSWDHKRCQKHLQKIDKHIEELVDNIQQTDEKEKDKGSLVKLKEDLADEQIRKAKIKDIVKKLNEKEQDKEQPKKPTHNTTDTDCVKGKTRQGNHAIYNVQISADKKHGLITHCDVVDHSQDANQFSVQLNNASDNLTKPPDIACADSGFHSLKDLAKVDQDKTGVIVPNQKPEQQKPFDKNNFIYDKEQDCYVCPEGQLLKYAERYKTDRVYRADGKACQRCPHFKKDGCTQSLKGRSIRRLKEESLAQQLQQIYESPKGQEIYALRKQKIELPFGHFKKNLSFGQFSLRRLAGVNAEASILSTCFNITRMMTLLGGVKEFTNALNQLKPT